MQRRRGMMIPRLPCNDLGILFSLPLSIRLFPRKSNVRTKNAIDGFPRKKNRSIIFGFFFLFRNKNVYGIRCRQCVNVWAERGENIFLNPCGYIGGWEKTFWNVRQRARKDFFCFFSESTMKGQKNYKKGFDSTHHTVSSKD